MKKIIRSFILLVSIAAMLFIPLAGCFGKPPGPPPPRPRIVKPNKPYQGARWVKGHWNWRGGRWVWIKGHWR